MAGCDDCAVDRSPLATSVESTLTLTLGLVGATFIPPRLQNDGVATPEMCIIMFVCLCGCIVFLLVVVIHHRSLVSLTRLPHSSPSLLSLLSVHTKFVVEKSDSCACA